MRTPASIAGHPIHPMLVTLPIGLWVFSFVCDLVYAFGSVTAVWKTVAFFTMAGGLVGALAAAIPGLIDLLSLPPGIRGTAIPSDWQGGLPFRYHIGPGPVVARVKVETDAETNGW